MKKTLLVLALLLIAAAAAFLTLGGGNDSSGRNGGTNSNFTVSDEEIEQLTKIPSLTQSFSNASANYDAKAAYAKGRSHVDDNFIAIFNRLLDQIDSAETLHHAKLFYEAMLGFRKAQESK